MEDQEKLLLTFLQETACRRSRYGTEYAALRRSADRSFQAFWKSLTKAQKKLYLRFEADSNAQSAAEEEEMVRQTFLLTRQLYR